MSRKEGKRGLASIKDYVDAEIQKIMDIKRGKED